MKKIEKYIGKLFRDITGNLKSFERSRGYERLHDVRVAIKKVKAAMNLVKDNQSKFKAHKQFKPLRDIFREAGDIRQPEVLFQLLLKYGVKDIKKDALLDVDNNVVEDFVRQVPYFIATCKRSKKDLLPYARKVNHQAVVKSIKKFEGKLQKALTNTIRFDTIHKTRKLVKQVLYVSDIHGDLKKKERKFFDDLQELIGAVHDKQMLMILLRKPVKSEYQKALGDLETAINADKNAIIEKCADFYGAGKIVFV